MSLQLFSRGSRVLRIAALNRSSRHSIWTPSVAAKEDVFTRLDPKDLAPPFKHRIAGRKYLPGSQGRGFPEYLATPRKDLPYAVCAADVRMNVEQWAQHCRHLLDEALPRYGVVLFRNLPFYKPGDFVKFTSGLRYTPATYEGGTGNRELLDEDAHVYFSTNDPPGFNIELHNEMACSTVYPRKVMFYCLVEPGEKCGGLTPLARNSEIFSKLDPAVVRKLEERKIRYIRYLEDESTQPYASWQQSFMTKDRKKAERFLEKAGFTYKWDSSWNLAYWYILPALVRHPVTGEKIWFTQPNVHHNTYYKESPMFDGVELPNHLYPTHATYGDGSEFEPELLEHIRATNWQSAVGFQWRKRDVLVIDNLLVQHSRLSYEGERRLLAYLTND